MLNMLWQSWKHCPHVEDDDQDLVEGFKVAISQVTIILTETNYIINIIRKVSKYNKISLSVSVIESCRLNRIYDMHEIRCNSLKIEVKIGCTVVTCIDFFPAQNRIKLKLSGNILLILTMH